MKKRMLFLMTLLVSAVVALSACGAGDKESNGGNEDISSGKPVYGGEIVVGVTNDLDSLDPHIALAAGTDEILFNVFEGLVKPDETGTLVPAVAESYEISDDGLVYTFKLRQGVKFHNGKDVTMDDVIYSLKRCAGKSENPDPQVAVESALSIISDISAVSADTLRITLSKSNTELICYLTCAIVPEDYKMQTTSPVGTGPFKFVSYSPLESFVIERFDDYYGEKPYVDKVTFKIFSSLEAASLEIMSGKIDIFPYLTDEMASQLSGVCKIEVGNMNLVQAMFLNNDFEPFSDIRVRQALCYAVDRQLILDMVAGGRGNVIGSGMFTGFSKYYNDDMTNYYSCDIKKAKELLKEAGYENGFEFTITVPSNYQYHIDTAQVIVEQLKAVGITAKIEQIEWASWLSDVYRGRLYEATIVGLDSNLAPSDILKRYRSTASNNFINYVNEEFDSIYAEAVASTDEAEKIVLYRKLQELLTKDAASVFIQDPPLMTAVNKELYGYTFYPVYVQDMSKVYFTEN